MFQVDNLGQYGTFKKRFYVVGVAV